METLQTTFWTLISSSAPLIRTTLIRSACKSRLVACELFPLICVHFLWAASSLSNLLTTAQENGNCFTLFHKSTSTELEDIAINSGLSESAVVRGSINESVNIESSLKPFAPNEIIRLRVNFHEEEYTTLNEPVSGRFIIHDNRNIAVIREKSYRIEPGKYYIFYLIKITDELLPEPYFTDCRDYRITDDSAELESQNKTGNLLLNAPSSKSNWSVCPKAGVMS